MWFIILYLAESSPSHLTPSSLKANPKALLRAIHHLFFVILLIPVSLHLSLSSLSLSLALSLSVFVCFQWQATPIKTYWKLHCYSGTALSNVPQLLLLGLVSADARETVRGDPEPVAIKKVVSNILRWRVNYLVVSLLLYYQWPHTNCQWTDLLQVNAMRIYL